MTRKRRQFSAKFKVKVAVEAIKGMKTLAELSTAYKVHPNQISVWKKQLLTNALELFPSGKKRRPKTEEEITAPLYEEIGRLKMDIKWFCCKKLLMSDTSPFWH
ncbi:MAG: transposase [Desulfobacter sp.]|nr:MAG: transposase [Desulfobacter sp.]